jgi:hypothetical protein
MGTVDVRRCTACGALTPSWGECRSCGASPGEVWTADERLGRTQDLITLGEETCDCSAREDGGEGHDGECAFYLAVRERYGPTHPLARFV